MIKRSDRRGVIQLAGFGLVTCMLIQPMNVYATETQSIKNVLQQAGIASYFDMNLTQEEYLTMAKEAEGASWGYTNIGIANVESGNLNVRSEASTKGKLVGKMPKNAACEVLDIDKETGWAHIKSGEVEGYVSTEFLLVGPDAKLRANELAHKVVIADTDGLRVRDEADVNSAVMTQILKGEELEYIETLDGWYKVYVDSEEGYVSAEYAHVEENLDTAVTMTELLYGMGVSDVRVELCEYAKQFVGNPYVWGGTSLTKGADCSGFVLSVFKKYGVSLPHHSGSQAKSGTKISRDELQAGDLIFYANSSGTINHVAIYIGGNQVVHASNPKSGIKISKYNYRTPVKYVRILQD
ncbi:MAG: C40 family peptidase [Lachnospiraceae bacterium]|nr:C40 family peptidase [Lachnospiraceae bacterium]